MRPRRLTLVLAGLVLLLFSLTPRPIYAERDVSARLPVTRADGAELVYATAAPASAQNPAFAPDGRTLVFTIFHRGYNRGRAGIYTLDLNSRAVTRVLDEKGQQSVNLPGASWNAAANRLTFASDRRAHDEIWTSAPDGSNLFRVTRHSSEAMWIEPSFSPDGQWIVFEAARAAPGRERQGRLYKIRADGSGLTRLTNGARGGTDDRQPNWSPRGDRIVFQRRALGKDKWYLYTIAPDGSHLQKITAGGGDTDASWSPDANWIVYSSDAGGLRAPNIFVVPAQGGAPRRVTRNRKHQDSAPSWSADGAWIAFESHRNDDTSPASLWRIGSH